MTTVDITFARALKIWWSYVWRVAVLWIPLGFALAFSMFLVLPHPRPGQPFPLTPAQIPGFMGRISILWLVMMALAVTVQTFAMRWMLKTRWSDFRLMPVPNEPRGGSVTNS
jgi:hypothetical protein